jgi:hypothetical protein
MSNPVFNAGKENLALARGVTSKLIDGLTDAQLMHRPDGKCNHMLWNLGHIACTDAYFTKAIGGRDTGWPEAWDALFGMGSTCQSSAKEYPSVAEIKAQLTKQRDEMLSWFGSMSAAELAKPLPQELQMFGSTVGQLMHSLAWHEGMHAGQMTSCRRGQGLGAAMG